MKLHRVLLALIASAVVGCQGDTPLAPAQPEPEFDLTLDGARIDLSIFDRSALGDIGGLIGVETATGGPLRGLGDPPILTSPTAPGDPPAFTPLETPVVLYYVTVWLFENGFLDAPSAISALLPAIDAFNWLIADNEPNAIDSFNEFIQVVEGLVDDSLLDPVAGQWLIDCAQGAIDQLLGVPPEVISTDPVDGATNVSTGTAISITFDEAVDITALGVILECPVSTAIPFSGLPAAGASLVVITPDAPLPEGVVCEVTVVATEVTDLDHTPDNMVADFQFSFTTEVTAAGQSAVAVNKSTVTSFSGLTMLADGIDVTLVVATVRDAAGNPVAGQPVVIAVSGSGNTVTQPVGVTSGAGQIQGSFTTLVAEIKTASATVVPIIRAPVPITQTVNVTANPPPP